MVNTEVPEAEHVAFDAVAVYVLPTVGLAYTVLMFSPAYGTVAAASEYNSVDGDHNTGAGPFVEIVKLSINHP